LRCIIMRSMNAPLKVVINPKNLVRSRGAPG
jgi:hypothetical protein